MLSLRAQVVGCAVVGRRPTFEGASRLLARSGLQFMTLTAEQQAALADTLHALATVAQPIA